MKVHLIRIVVTETLMKRRGTDLNLLSQYAVNASQGQTSSYVPSLTGSEAASWNMYLADNHSVGNEVFQIYQACSGWVKCSISRCFIKPKINKYTTRLYSFSNSADPYSYTSMDTKVVNGFFWDVRDAAVAFEEVVRIDGYAGEFNPLGCSLVVGSQLLSIGRFYDLDRLGSDFICVSVVNGNKPLSSLVLGVGYALELQLTDGLRINLYITRWLLKQKHALIRTM
ncbi:putative leukocyte receptor cluster (lrc) member [Corchorus olitorius]|uniref:Leukocyte receptor cluster (Lrc) member n=1 Tax=Corchorus olitorius TaxID=93759 RepID=A0A1R3HA51_9ROSI|nr:putative leukocyte receptor cluster (lrc) member [Corchorus olitorius]